MSADAKTRKVLAPFLVATVARDNGDIESFCPVHEDPATSKKPSAYINFERAIWYCFRCKPKGTESSLKALLVRLKKRIDTGEIEAPTNVVSLDERRESTGKRKPAVDRALPTDDDLDGFAENLAEIPAKMKWLREHRGFKTDTIRQWRLGWVPYRQRYIIPIFNNDAQCINGRLYQRDAERNKFMWWTVGGQPNYLIGFEYLEPTPWVVLMEGEWDTILCQQDGFPAVGHTAGAGKFKAEWAKEFEGKIVFICYDNDEAGRKGRRKVLDILKSTAEAVYFVDLPGAGTDYTDFRIRDRKPASAFRDLLDVAREKGPEWREERGELPLKGEVVTVAESFNAARNGEPVEIVAHVTGRVDPPYSLPREVTFTCDMDNGTTCNGCPMSALHGGQVVMKIPANDPMIPRMIDSTEDRGEKILRKAIAARCSSHLDIDIESSWTVEQLTIEETIDRKRVAGEEEGNVSGVRQIFNVAGHDTEVNAAVRIVGTQTAGPKDQRVVFTSWHLEPVSTSLDQFRMTEDVRQRLTVFQVKEGQDPLQKMRFIAKDLSANVTGILGTERRMLHMALDVAWHSVLDFDFNGSRIGKGWVEMIVVGDSRTGKSEVAKSYIRHYGSGVLYSCDQASLAGLIGGVSQPVGRQWMMRWGALPVNDRRLVVLDEAQSLKDRGIIEQMSSVRSSGLAEVTKIETASTPARTRIVWIANPANGRPVRELPDGGMDGVRQLLPAHEDIARFDLAMAVARNDVSADIINSSERPVVRHRYTERASAELVMWAWSRRVDQIRWKDGAEKEVLQQATVMGDAYSPDFPLVQHENIRMKIARVAVAIAARLFSTDESGELVMVGTEHVHAAVAFMRSLYDAEVFGYGRMSRRAAAEDKVSHEMAPEVEKWLRGHPMPDHSGPATLRALTALGGSFEHRYFAATAGLDQLESSRSLSYLTDSQMLRHTHAGRRLVMAPALAQIVRKLDDERTRSL